MIQLYTANKRLMWDSMSKKNYKNGKDIHAISNQKKGRCGCTNMKQTRL